ncbi:MAG: DUF4388 domain-containing protein [Acidimicrobiales bacterium]
MSLRGSLETISLQEVLRLLARSGETGVLNVSGEGVAGSVFLEAGLVVGAHNSVTKQVIDVVLDLSRLKSGEFSLDQGAAPPADEVSLTVEDLLAGVAGRLALWQDLATTIPSTDSVPSLAEAIPGARIELNADQWRLVCAVARATSVQDLINNHDMDEMECLIGLKELVEMGLVEIGPALSPTARREANPAVGVEALDASRSSLWPPSLVGESLPGEQSTMPTEAGSGRAQMDQGVPIRTADARWLDEEPVDRGLVLRFLSSVRS